jgi:hypothetical protein
VDDIWLFHCKFAPEGGTALSQAKRREVLAHEFGHALGRADGGVERQGYSYLMNSVANSVDPFAACADALGRGVTNEGTTMTDGDAILRAR